MRAHVKVHICVNHTFGGLSLFKVNDWLKKSNRKMGMFGPDNYSSPIFFLSGSPNSIKRTDEASNRLKLPLFHHIDRMKFSAGKYSIFDFKKSRYDGEMNVMN